MQYDQIHPTYDVIRHTNAAQWRRVEANNADDALKKAKELGIVNSKLDWTQNETYEIIEVGIGGIELTEVTV